MPLDYSNGASAQRLMIERLVTPRGHALIVTLWFSRDASSRYSLLCQQHNTVVVLTSDSK